MYKLQRGAGNVKRIVTAELFWYPEKSGISYHDKIGVSI